VEKTMEEEGSLLREGTFELQLPKIREKSNLMRGFSDIEKDLEMERTRYTDLFREMPAQREDLMQKETEITTTITVPKIDVPWVPRTTETPPPEPPPKIRITIPDKDRRELPPLPRRFAAFTMGRGKREKSLWEPISDPWSKYLTEVQTGRPATSPSIKVAKRLWAESGGEIIPTAEELQAARKLPKPRKPQAIRMKKPKLSRPKRPKMGRLKLKRRMR